MGVMTTVRLEAGEKFGPVPLTLTLAEPTMLIGHRTCDTLPDIHTVKVNRSPVCKLCRPHRVRSVNKMHYYRRSRWFVGLSVGHVHEPCKTAELI